MLQENFDQVADLYPSGSVSVLERQLDCGSAGRTTYTCKPQMCLVSVSADHIRSFPYTTDIDSLVGCDLDGASCQRLPLSPLFMLQVGQPKRWEDSDIASPSLM